MSRWLARRHDKPAILLTRECDDGALHLAGVLHVNQVNSTRDAALGPDRGILAQPGGK
jgi:hypothetical protein